MPHVRPPCMSQPSDNAQCSTRCSWLVDLTIHDSFMMGLWLMASPRVSLPGSLYHQPAKMHYYREIPSKSLYTFALLDPPIMGNLMTPGLSHKNGCFIHLRWFRMFVIVWYCLSICTVAGLFFPFNKLAAGHSKSKYVYTWWVLDDTEQYNCACLNYRTG